MQQDSIYHENPKEDEISSALVEVVSTQRKFKFFSLAALSVLTLVTICHSIKGHLQLKTVPSKRNSSSEIRFLYPQRISNWRNYIGSYGFGAISRDEGVDPNGSWREVVESVDGTESSELGWCVTMSSGGFRFAAGCPGDGPNHEGSVIAFDSSTRYPQQMGQKILGDQGDDETGYNIQMSDDGNWLIIGEPQATIDGMKKAGRVRVFKYSFDEKQWVKQGNDLTGSNKKDLLGESVSISNWGKKIVVGHPREGMATVYELEDETWKMLGEKFGIGGDNPGATVSMTHDGVHVAIGASKGNVVKIFEFSKNKWKQMGNDLTGENSEDEYGYSLSLTKSLSTIRLAVGTVSGTIVQTYLYGSEIKEWNKYGEVVADDEEKGFGKALSLIDTNYLAIGNPDHSDQKGQVIVYHFRSNGWEQFGNELIGDEDGDQFGNSVVLTKTTMRLLVGAPGRKKENGQASMYEHINEDQETTLQ